MKPDSATAPNYNVQWRPMTPSTKLQNDIVEFIDGWNVLPPLQKLAAATIMQIAKRAAHDKKKLGKLRGIFECLRRTPGYAAYAIEEAACVPETLPHNLPTMVVQTCLELGPSSKKDLWTAVLADIESAVGIGPIGVAQIVEDRLAKAT